MSCSTTNPAAGIANLTSFDSNRAFAGHRLYPSFLILFFVVITGFPLRGHAQDTRAITEPVFPATCAVYHAPLQSTASGPVVGSSVTEQDTESEAETSTLTNDLNDCAKNSPGQAVELALGTDASYNAFLINPVTIPPGTSLIIDGGVTVYASLDPANYQDPNYLPGNSNQNPTVYCGTDGPYPGLVGCISLISMGAGSGIYGYGIIDAQGGGALLSGSDAGMTWWQLTEGKTDTTEQASPSVIRATGDNMTLYKFTVRNPPFHTILLKGDGITVWGVKVQSPWNIGNTDGFDPGGTNMTIYDTTVSNGDQDIALGTNGGPTANITVNKFHLYSKGGIALLGDGAIGTTPISNVLVENSNMTGDLPVVDVANRTVNGVTESEMQKYVTNPDPKNPLQYTQALPNSIGTLHAIQIVPMTGTRDATKPAAAFSNITFKSICVQDLETPLQINASVSITGPNYPTVTGITFQDIHVLAPTPQFPTLRGGLPVTPAAPGTYKLLFNGAPPNFVSQFALDNVVFDDPDPATNPAPGDTTISSITARGNLISTLTNIYPPVLNELAAATSDKDQHMTYQNTDLTLNGNSYAFATSMQERSKAYSCPASTWPYTTGDLYLSSGSSAATGSATNLQTLSIPQGTSFTLNAVLQPIMSQTTHYSPGFYGAVPGILAIGSPALTNSIRFIEDTNIVGEAKLSANGTLASVVLSGVAPGSHTYSARYPGDTYYSALNFGSVTVTVVPPAATTTTLSASATTVVAGTSVNFTAKVVPPSGNTAIPTGSIAFLDGTTTLATVSLDPTGSAAYSTSSLAAGSHTITASYSGDSNFTASTSGVVAVIVAPPAVTTTTLSASATTVISGTSISFTAKVAPPSGNTTIPTGSVTFLDGTTTLATVNLDLTQAAAYSTSALALGSHSITATYSGDPVYAASTSAAVNITVNTPPPSDFSVSVNTNSITLSKFTPATMNVSLTPLNGFNAAVTFACSGLPVGVSCSFNPSTVTPSGTDPASTTVTLSAGATNTAMLQHASLVTLAFSLGGWLLIRARRRALALGLWTVLLAATLGGMTGCGGGGETSATVSKITITATSGSASHATDISLTYLKVD